MVGDDLPDAVNEAALVIGDEAHKDALLGRVEQHEDAHLARRRGVREVDAPSLGGEGETLSSLAKNSRKKLPLDFLYMLKFPSARTNKAWYKVPIFAFVCYNGYTSEIL